MHLEIGKNATKSIFVLSTFLEAVDMVVSTGKNITNKGVRDRAIVNCESS